MKAILFDLGHTLIDYYHDWKEPEMKAIKKVYRILSTDFGIPDEEEDFYQHLSRLLMEAREAKIKKMIEVPLSDVLDRCFHRYGCDGDDDLMDKALHAFYETLLENRQLIPGAKEMLDKVHARGYAIGLISDVAWGLPSEFPLRDMRYYGIDQYFDDLIFSTDVGLRKPNPKIFKMALSNLDARPDEAMFIGNSLQADIKGAKGVGMVAILKESKFYQHDDSIVPDEKISHWDEIDRILVKYTRR
ncbi:MAG: HAD-IA family hydrolase [Methanomassiliicoccales archaeon]|nr:HAD-IA family hydrolase [Methanomassiliicoccales archaeon]